MALSYWISGPCGTEHVGPNSPTVILTRSEKPIFFSKKGGSQNSSLDISIMALKSVGRSYHLNSRVCFNIAKHPDSKSNIIAPSISVDLNMTPGETLKMGQVRLDGLLFDVFVALRLLDGKPVDSEIVQL